MSWERLIGQKPAKLYLRAALSGGRLAQAYLFKGPAGVGKRTAAWIFAQAALCQAATHEAACGQCQSCRWFEARQGALTGHPDVISLLKFSPGETGRVEKLAGDHEPVLRIETVHYVCEQLHRSPMAGRRRVAIIPEAQRLCRGQAEAANAFLKTLEEPPAAALIILTSSQPEGLLETITSRAQAVQFRRLSLAEVKTGLERAAGNANLPIGALEKTANQEIGVPGLETAALLADGSLGRALELLHGDLKNWRQAVLKELSRLGYKACPSFGLALWLLAETEGARLFTAEKDAAQALTETEDEPAEENDEAVARTEAGWKRFVFRRLLELCEISFRDALVCAASGEPEAAVLLQPDQRELAQKLGGSFGGEGCQKALQAIKESLSAVGLYVRGDVVARALAGRLVEALK